MEERRRFVRHPIEIPLTYKVLNNDRFNLSQTKNLSDFGISFLSNDPLPIGQVIEINITSPRVHLLAKSVVKWQKYSTEECKYRVGVMFINRQEGFRARMVEQMCHIDLYRRRKMQEENRDIPYNEAAFEWITLNGKKFAEGLVEAY